MMRGYGLFNGGYGMSGGGLGMWFVGLLWLLVIAAIVVLVVMVARRANGHGHPGMMGMMHHGPSGTPPTAGHDEAVTIARKRYAAGEVTKEQFDEMMKTLG